MFRKLVKNILFYAVDLSHWSATPRNPNWRHASQPLAWLSSRASSPSVRTEWNYSHWEKRGQSYIFFYLKHILSANVHLSYVHSYILNVQLWHKCTVWPSNFVYFTGFLIKFSVLPWPAMWSFVTLLTSKGEILICLMNLIF